MTVEELYRRHARGLLAVLRRTVPANPDFIEEAASFAWERLLSRPDVLSWENPVGWLYVVARHEVQRIRQHAYDQGVRAADLGEVDVFRSAGIEDQLRARDALRALASTNDRNGSREVFIDHVAGFSYDEIQARHKVTFSKVNRSIQRTRTELREAA